MQHGWNAYLRMVDIDYQVNFTCPTCKTNPDVVILDGVTLGTLKHIPEIAHQVDNQQKYSIIPFSDRTLIPNSETRKKLKEYSSIGLNQSSFNEMITSIYLKELVDYLLFSCTVFEGWSNIRVDFPRVSLFLNLLCYPSPLCGIFQFSMLDKNERRLLVQLSKGNFISKSDLRLIFMKIRSFELLFNSLPPRVNIEGEKALHNVITPLLTLILQQIDTLVKHPSRQLLNYSSTISDYFNYFPRFSTNYKSVNS